MDIVKFESEDKKKEKQDKMFARVSVIAEKISKKILKGDIQSAYDKGFKEGYDKGRSED